MSLSEVKDPSLGYFIQSPYFLPEELPHVGYPCLDGAFTERGWGGGGLLENTDPAHPISILCPLV